jgi:carboxymethylenebutenolidase
MCRHPQGLPIMDLTITTANHELPVILSRPQGEGPWPGVVVIHDALGMTPDTKRQTEWLAEAGFIAAAPNLFHTGGQLRCMFSAMRDITRGKGPSFDDIEATRSYLVNLSGCTGKVGLIGFCLGGGYAAMMAPSRYGFDASSINYGAMPNDPEDFFADACPIVGSFGRKDKSLKGAAADLSSVLEHNRIPHDIKEYPEAGHSFMNDHHDIKTPLIFRLLSYSIGGANYHEPSALDARKRIAAFFSEHLQ